MTAEYLAADLEEDYLAAERALRVSVEAATPRGVTMQQHAPGLETLGDDGEPPESELSVTGVSHAEQQAAGAITAGDQR